MSLQSNPLAGYEHVDNAALEADGHWYRCTVWRNKAQGTIECECVVVGEHGQTSDVFRSVLDRFIVNGIVESPKIIAVGTTFVVHWIESVFEVEGGVHTLHRATMDMTAFDASSSGWTDRGTVSLFRYALYDACSVRTDIYTGVHATEFVVARMTANDTVTVTRYNGFDWVDTAWSTPITRSIYQTVLAVYANDVDNDVVLAYQRALGGAVTADGLWTAHINANDGGGFVDAETFTEFDPAAYLQAAFEYVDSNTVAIVCEAALQEFIVNTPSFPDAVYAAMHHLVYRTVNSNTGAPVSNVHWAAHFNQCSRPFSHVDGAGNRSLYVLASYKSVGTPGNSPRIPPLAADQPDPDLAGSINPGPQASDWEQAYFFGLNLDYTLWDTVADGAGLRPRIVQTVYTQGVPDARQSRLTLGDEDGINTFAWPNASGDTLRVGKRCNHVSHAAPPPPTGPDLKTRSIACVIFADLRAQAFATADSDADPTDGSELAPQNAGVTEFRWYVEDPWTVYRNGENNGDAQPQDNFKGANIRAMCQPIEIGESAFFSGGTPYVYDGRAMVEAGFPWRPELLNMVVEIVEGDLTGGDHQVYWCWSWRDNAGQIHRSGPSAIYAFTAATTGVNYHIRTLTASLKDALAHYPMAAPIQCEVYRTTAGGTLFFRVYGANPADFASDFTTSDTPTNDPLEHEIVIFDGVSDAALQLQGLGPYQYATDSNGNITGFPDTLVQTPPAMHAVCTAFNRIMGADSCVPGTWIYSDELLYDYGSDFRAAPTWNDSQTFYMGDVGEIVASQPMNNAVIVYTTKGVYALTAQDAGGGLLSWTMDVLQEGTVCIEPRSLVYMPMGVMYQSAKGFYLSNRGREADYASAGANIEDDIREAGNIRGACQLGDRHQVRLGANGRVVRHYTTTFTITGDEPAGEWQIAITGSGFTAVFEAGGGVFADVADALEADFDAALATTLADYVTGASSPNNTVVVTWEPDVVPAYTTQAPGGCSLTGVDTMVEETFPRVEIYDYLYRRWSRADLVQTHISPRYAEVVDSLAWQGLERGGTAHVVLTQGALLVERAEGDPLEFADQTTVANVGIPLDLQLAMQSFAGLGGEQRCRNIFVVASKPNASEFSVDLQYVIHGDYDNPESDDDVTVASTTPPMSRYRPRIQRANGHSCRIYEQSGVGTFENVKITAVVFDVAILNRAANVRDAQIGA